MNSLPRHGTNRADGGGGKANRKNGRLRPVRALVLSPTRELAVQIADSLDRYGKFTPLKQAVVYGGVSQHHQVQALRRGVDALVAKIKALGIA